MVPCFVFILWWQNGAIILSKSPLSTQMSPFCHLRSRSMKWDSWLSLSMPWWPKFLIPPGCLVGWVHECLDVEVLLSWMDLCSKKATSDGEQIPHHLLWSDPDPLPIGAGRGKRSAGWIGTTPIQKSWQENCRFVVASYVAHPAIQVDNVSSWTVAGFCMLKGLIELRKHGVFTSALIKKHWYWPKCYVVNGCTYGRKTIGCCWCPSRTNGQRLLQHLCYEGRWTWHHAYGDLWWATYQGGTKWHYAHGARQTPKNDQDIQVPSALWWLATTFTATSSMTTTIIATTRALSADCLWRQLGSLTGGRTGCLRLSWEFARSTHTLQ